MASIDFRNKVQGVSIASHGWASGSDDTFLVPVRDFYAGSSPPEGIPSHHHDRHSRDLEEGPSGCASACPTCRTDDDDLVEDVSHAFFCSSCSLACIVS